MTALQAAGHYGEYEMLPLLLEYGANVNAEPGEFGCALQALVSSVCYHGSGDLIRIRDIDKTATKQREQASAIHLLLEAGADVNRQGGEFGSPLGAAAAFGLEAVVGELLGRGADPNLSSGRLGTALTAASARGGMPVEWLISLIEPEAYKRIAEQLFRAGANVNAVGGIYGTALQASAAVGEFGILKMLLDEGKADPNVRAGSNGSALGAAAYSGHLDIVKTLLSAGAEIGPTKYIPSEHDDWEFWRPEPVGALFLAYGAALPRARVVPPPREEATGERVDDPLVYAVGRELREVVQVLSGQD